MSTLKVPNPSPGVDPAATKLAQNLDALHNSGFGYLEPIVQASLAHGAASPAHAVQLGNAVQASLIPNVAPAINHIFSDPQLTKIPTASQQISFWFNGSQGKYPVSEQDVGKIQQDMIDKGQAFPGATVTRTWSPEWQNALVNSSAGVLNAPGFGNADSKSVLSNLFNQGKLSTGLNSVYAAVKSMPRSILHLLGDTVSGTNAALNPLAYLANKTTNNSLAPVGQNIANAQIFPGKPTQKQTPEEYTQASQNRTIEDIGTALSFVPVGKLAFGAKAATSEAVGKGLIKSVAFSEVAPKFTILKGIQYAAQTGGESVLPKVLPRVIANTPIVRWMYPAIEKGIGATAPAQMAIRNLFAQRLRLPIVQAANEIAQKTIVAGAVETGIGNAEAKLSGHDTPLDTAIHTLHPIAGRLANAFDIFAMQANPGAKAAPSVASYAHDVQTGSNAMRTALDETGALIAWQKANPELNLDELIAQHGAPLVYQHITDQINKMAALHATDLRLNPLKAEGPSGTWAMLSDEEKAQQLQDLSHDIWKSSENGPASELHQARASIMLDQNALESGFRAVRDMAGRDTRLKAEGAGFNNFMQARNIGQDFFSPEVQKWIIHPGTVEAFNKAKGDIPPWETATAKADFTPEDISMLKDYTTRSILYTKEFAVGEKNSEALNNILLKSTIDNGTYYRALTPQDISEIKNIKPGQVWDTQIQKSITKDFSTVVDIANNQLRVAKESSGVLAKIIIDKPVNGIADLNSIAKMVNRDGEGLMGSTKLILKEITTNKETGLKEYIFGVKVGKEVSPLKMDARWMDMNNPEMQRGTFGIARKESLTKPDAYVIANNFKDSLTNATIEEKIAIKKEIAKTLINEFGIDARQLDYLSPEKMLDTLYAKADTLPVPINAMFNAPREVKDLFAKMDELGYKPIAGTDIGHFFTKDLQGVDLGSAERNIAAQIAAKFGLSPRLSDSSAVSTRSAIEQNIAIQKAIDEGKVVVPPSFNAPRIISWIRQGLDENRDFSIGQQKVIETAMTGKKGGLYKNEINKLVANGMTKEDAIAAILKAKKSEMGLRDATDKELLTALTRPMDVVSADLMGFPEGTPFMDKKSAYAVMQAIWRSRLAVPSEMIGGIARFEDYLYAGAIPVPKFLSAPLNIMGKNIGKDIQIAGREISGVTIPNFMASALNMRNRVRFQESILFAYRRVFKTMAKGVTEGVPPTMYPRVKMEAMGIYDKAKDLYSKLYPEENVKNLFMDDVERMMNEGDLWNLYSPRDFKMWNVYHLDQQGFKGKELLDKVERVMGYGQRTAAERSLNAIFYPFSFNKTLMRQFGGYLLTHPGQRMVGSAMLSLYDTHDGPKMRKWLEDNMPLIKEVEKLNAFEHGTGLGAIGGINMPYAQPAFKAFATMLGPKQVTYTDPKQGAAVLKALETYIPLLKSFHDVINESYDSGRTTAALAMSRVGAYNFGSDTMPSPQYLMPDKAQQSNAWDYRTNLISQLASVMDYNYKHPNGQYTWGMIKNNKGQSIPTETGLTDKPINKATIGELVHYRYPAWDNTQSSAAAQKKKNEADRFIGGVTGINPERGASYRKLDDYATRVSDLVAKDNIKTDSLVAVTDAFRKLAIDISMQDPNFYKFYKTHYQRIFGPLESFK